MKPEALKLQRTIALKEVARQRVEHEGQPVSDRFLAGKASDLSGATVEQVLKWMREGRA